MVIRGELPARSSSDVDVRLIGFLASAIMMEPSSLTVASSIVSLSQPDTGAESPNR